MFPWGPPEDFLIGVGIGFLEEEVINFPWCGGEIYVDALQEADEEDPGPECARNRDGRYRCPYRYETLTSD